jgi:hypothetical protein
VPQKFLAFCGPHAKSKIENGMYWPFTCLYVWYIGYLKKFV